MGKDIPQILLKKITDKYSVERNTFVLLVKDDWKDRIKTEIGDIKWVSCRIYQEVT